MRCPTLTEIPAPPPDKTGWPWTEESRQLPDTMADGSAWPLVSVVTPSLNQGAFIEETIRSVLLQGYPNLEYVIIDGGSSDGSVEIIRRYEPWLAYWVSEPDEGQADAVNKGWRLCQGEIATWLNSDDVYARGAVARAAEVMSSRADAGLVYGQCEYADAAGRRTGLLKGQAFELAEMLRLGRNYIPQPSAFVRRLALGQVGMLDSELHMAMDLDLWLRLALSYPVVFVPEVWSYFHRHSLAKTSTQFARDGVERLRIVKALFSRPDLPGDLAAVRAEACARAGVAAARGLAELGRRPEARRCLVKAVSAAPGVAVREAKGLTVELLLGPRCAASLRRALGTRAARGGG